MNRFWFLAIRYSPKVARQSIQVISNSLFTHDFYSTANSSQAKAQGHALEDPAIRLRLPYRSLMLCLVPTTMI